jgi:hypothetical protein
MPLYIGTMVFLIKKSLNRVDGYNVPLVVCLDGIFAFGLHRLYLALEVAK